MKLVLFLLFLLEELKHALDNVNSKAVVTVSLLAPVATAAAKQVKTKTGKV